MALKKSENKCYCLCFHEQRSEKKSLWLKNWINITQMLKMFAWVEKNNNNFTRVEKDKTTWYSYIIMYVIHSLMLEVRIKEWMLTSDGRLTATLTLFLTPSAKVCIALEKPTQKCVGKRKWILLWTLLCINNMLTTLVWTSVHTLVTSAHTYVF